MKHYIALSGMCGCLADCCMVFTDRNDAIGSILFVHDLEDCDQCVKDLEQNGIIECPNSGADYIEIIECECECPWVHDDGFTKEDWAELMEANVI